MTSPIVDLDFDQIKFNIISYIKANPTFSDYNFEGSALNTLIDILAYNTHTNAYLANMIHSENFIDTAQKRGSIVSRAKELGYVPKSARCSTAYVDVSVTVPNLYDSVILERGFTFYSSNSNDAYTFAVQETTTPVSSGYSRTFSNLKIINGLRSTNSFIINTIKNPRSIFTIPNADLDTTTLKVYLRDSILTTERIEMNLATSIYDLNAESNVYFIQESYSGLYQIYFGNNILGKQPETGNVVDIDYFVTSAKDLANECSNFYYNGSLGSSSNVTTSQNSYGGSEAEDIESIRYKSVISNAAKERAVTVSDYVSFIKNNFSFVKSVSVWGGEDNVPPVYGKVFISLQAQNGFVITDDIKLNTITPLIKKNSLLTVSINYVDPEYFNIGFETSVKYNSVKTTIPKSDIITTIKNKIVSYIDSISMFNTDYLEAVLISNILSIDSSLVSLSVNKRIYFEISPIIGTNTTYIKNFSNSILPGSIVSTFFNTFVSDVLTQVFIKDVPNSEFSLNSKTYVNLGLYNKNSILLSTLGTVDITSGIFNFSVNLYSYITDTPYVTIKFKPVNDDITITGNKFLILKEDLIDTEIGLESNNIVNLQVYDK